MFGVLSVIEPEIDGMVVSWGYSQSRNINAFDEIFLSEILAVARIWPIKALRFRLFFDPID